MQQSTSMFPLVAVVGCIVVGVVGVFFSLVFSLNGNPLGGLMLIAAALAFGLLANAMYRS
ncbi:MAG TPA: hypothetical protein VFE05_14790 [Longimicrobiaceae bacterium]|jgi:hypothetical protein|nr:hypothetical protein [Longimicrobiaceae bacterium]